MALDARLVDLWDREDQTCKTFFEITPAGKYYVYDQFYDYSINQDCTELTIRYPNETAVFTRVGSPVQSLAGQWVRVHDNQEKGTTETWNFNGDGTYQGHWDQSIWFSGLYEDTGAQLRTIEFRGDVITQDNIWRHVIWGNAYEYRYEFTESENVVSQYEKDTDEFVCSLRRRTA